VPDVGRADRSGQRLGANRGHRTGRRYLRLAGTVTRGFLAFLSTPARSERSGPGVGAQWKGAVDEPARQARNGHGVTSGIGPATAQAATADGAAVIASDNANRVSAAAGTMPGGTEGRVVDVTSEEAVRQLFGELGSFDHLVYTAGEPLAVTQLGSLDL
jgi:hypothetical protein